MAFESTDSQKPMPLFDNSTRLAETNAVVWFLGFGVGGATGLAFIYALITLWSRAPNWIAIVAMLVATIHALIVSAFWIYREVVRRRTALMISMIASALLTSLLAWMIGSNGMQSSPLYGLACSHLIMAFCHPANFTTTKQCDNNAELL